MTKQFECKPGTDLEAWARVLRRAHELTLRDGRAPELIRGHILSSWKRCMVNGASTSAHDVPMAFDPGDVREQWREHPLFRCCDVVRDVLREALNSAQHIVVVSDANGCLLWSEGHSNVLRAAEGIQFTPGRMWNEASVGTNGVGTALASESAVQIFSAEHYRLDLHSWECSAAPIRDQASGKILGVIGMSGSYRATLPHGLALVRAAAALTEQTLYREMLERDFDTLQLYSDYISRGGGRAAAVSRSGRLLAPTSEGWPYQDSFLPLAAGDDIVLADGSEAAVERLGEFGLLLRPKRAGAGNASAFKFRLSVFGPRRVAVEGPGEPKWLSPRQSEIVVLLALNPQGLTMRQLGQLLYGEPGHEASTRVELHRLRAILGQCLATRPYRLRDIHVSVDRIRDVLANLGWGIPYL